MNSDKGCSRDSVSSESPDNDISNINCNNDSVGNLHIDYDIGDDDDDDDDDDDGGGGSDNDDDDGSDDDVVKDNSNDDSVVPNMSKLLSFSLSRSAMLLIYGGNQYIIIYNPNTATRLLISNTNRLLISKNVTTIL